MQGVWKALARRSHSPWAFFITCERGITGWQLDQKQSAAERRGVYQDILDTVTKLRSLMVSVDAFDQYSIADLVTGDDVWNFFKSLESSSSISGLSNTDPAIHEVSSDKNNYHLSFIVPSLPMVLDDICKVAADYQAESLIVKKPNSPNANIHYFVRTLSSHFRCICDQPLHHVVAATTSVVFDLPDCDVDYVRKLVKPKPREKQIDSQSSFLNQ